MNKLPHKHIHEKFRHIATMSNEERIKFIDTPRWFGYDKASRVIENMQGLMNMVQQHRMPNLLIIGDSNNGKTTIIKQFVKRFGDSYIDDDLNLVVPVISIQAPPSVSEKDLYVALIDALSLPYNISNSTTKFRYQVVHSLLETQVKIIVIDEIHSMLTGTARQQRQIMNTIKYLCNQLQIPIVLSGTKDAVRILHTDPQHASRFDVAELLLWKNDREFRKLVSTFEHVLPLKNASNLIEPAKLNLIHSISGGCIGNVKRLMIECAKEAIISGAEEITIKSIEDKSWLRPKRGIRTIIG